MSKVAIAGNASGTGTFTIQAPNSNTDRVLSLPDEAGTVVTTGSYVAGITHMTQFRLTTNYDPGGDADITANIEEVDNATYARLGSAVTQSSGIFTFPTEGLWQVIAVGAVLADVDNNAGVVIQASTDSGSNYSILAISYGGQNSGTAGTDSISTTAYINCTNASTFRVKFQSQSFGNTATTFVGNTDYNVTHFTFLRIGDAQ